MTYWQRLSDWAKRPFSVDMTAGEWFLFIGLIILLIALWNIILYRITELVRVE